MLKKEFIKTVILLLASNVLFAQIPTDGLVGYWPFNSNSNDASGNGNNIVINGATLTTDQNGNENEAYSFNGTNSYGNIPVNISGDKTVCFWAKAESLSQGIIFGAQDTYRFYVGYKDFDQDGIFNLGMGIGFESWTQFDTDIEMDLDWHFYTLLYDSNSNFTLYIDCIQVGVKNDSHEPSINYYLGANNYNNSGSNYFNGKIDEVRVYNRVLSVAEITDIYRGNSSISSLWSENGLDIYRLTGNVGIGTTDPGSYKLAVEGIIGAHEIKVTTDGWADFVFEENYSLMSLSELDAYIKANRHLPEIPTTEEVEENGISVGEMNAKLLQKIEELTLYLIEMKKENDELKTRVEKLEKKN